ncbi:MAG: phenol degradation protein meta, partial [Pseudolabrys sp.]
MSTLYLHSFVSAGGGVAASRTIGFPNRPVNLSVDLNAQIKGTADVVAFGPTYVFATPVLGGQFAITALG